MVNGWKVTAIVFMILFVLENLFFGYAYFLVLEEEDNTRTCYYDVCSGYVEALYEDKVCYCYEYDMFGEYQIAKTEVMD